MCVFCLCMRFQLYNNNILINCQDWDCRDCIISERLETTDYIIQFSMMHHNDTLDMLVPIESFCASVALKSMCCLEYCCSRE